MGFSQVEVPLYMTKTATDNLKHTLPMFNKLWLPGVHDDKDYKTVIQNTWVAKIFLIQWMDMLRYQFIFPHFFFWGILTI